MVAARIVVGVMHDAAARIEDVFTADFDIVAGLERYRPGDVDVVFDAHRQPVSGGAAQVEQKTLVLAAAPQARPENASDRTAGRDLDVRALGLPGIVDRAIGGVGTAPARNSAASALAAATAARIRLHHIVGQVVTQYVLGGFPPNDQAVRAAAREGYGYCRPRTRL